MDSSYRSFNDDVVAEVSSPFEPRDERRLHVRAYEYWTSLLNGRPCPSIEDLDSSKLAGFSSNSVLLDFTASRDNPQITYLGRALREESGILYGIRAMADVPERSLLSRVTEKFAAILANPKPTSFEADFISHRGVPTRYRGILLPFASAGHSVGFVYGVISWKTDERPSPAIAVPAPITDTGRLADYLHLARQTAETAQRSESRAHVALYAAIGTAYDFAIAAAEEPEAFAALLDREGLAVQARAPMTPIVKLVFGADYDKKRLSEYAAALTHAQRAQLKAGTLASYLEGYEGGLKALVAFERAQRVPAHKADRGDAARSALRTAAPLAEVALDAGDAGEFVLLLARRDGPGQLAVVKTLADQALIDKAVRLSAPVRKRG